MAGLKRFTIWKLLQFKIKTELGEMGLETVCEIVIILHNALFHYLNTCSHCYSHLILILNFLEVIPDCGCLWLRPSTLKILKEPWFWGKHRPPALWKMGPSKTPRFENSKNDKLIFKNQQSFMKTCRFLQHLKIRLSSLVVEPNQTLISLSSFTFFSDKC